MVSQPQMFNKIRFLLSRWTTRVRAFQTYPPELPLVDGISGSWFWSSVTPFPKRGTQQPGVRTNPFILWSV